MKAATEAHLNFVSFKEAFQSTPPVKAATNGAFLNSANLKISIHAAREGGDSAAVGAALLTGLFQSTPPVKAATTTPAMYLDDVLISIHAAREGGDSVVRPQSRAQAISIHAAREGGDG